MKIAATNRDPREALDAGDLREDLYYCVNVFTLELPALRNRIDDVPMLVDAFVHDFNGRTGKALKGIDDEAVDSLKAYHWPGNVRELRNVIERAVIIAKERRVATRGFAAAGPRAQKSAGAERRRGASGRNDSGASGEELDLEDSGVYRAE